MLFSSILAPAALLSLASASTLPLAKKDDCIPAVTAHKIVDDFILTLTNFTGDNAKNLLTDAHFSDTSSSINFFTGAPLDGFTFADKTAFISGQGAQPPVNVTLIKIDSVTCDGIITFRWQATFPRTIAKGINVLYTAKTGSDANVVGPKGYQIQTIFSEFNSATWDLGFGGACTPPKTS
ncbi:uncharacterized protein A1O9_06372 [Exophiala aquamarina CBS 119918]|uniref:NTF2-like domain-containing protein n=1 Tax=Exophiala aquamarina CBS 119918 TaxID=1182545 RepID=A0A072PEZ2_9EURO|nr:uncharacterized protein A1O9_06372 [Exophiala aquamarina CBS 119918]KEF58446.1 hypothetical protein A1O9_06372 [Exophiala aquamarina CBS 119918]